MKGHRLYGVALIPLLVSCTGPAADTGLSPELAALRHRAHQGEAVAQVELGLRYLTGQGLDPDEQQALAWMARAAAQGHPIAQYQLGSFYTLERPTRDDQKASAWLQKAAVQGYAPAQFSLGVLYALGRGVPQNQPHAYAWLNLAAAQGDLDAVPWVKSLIAAMNEAELAQAHRLFLDYQANYLPPERHKRADDER